MSLSSRSSSSGRSSDGSARQQPLTGYYAYRHPPGGNEGGGLEKVEYATTSSLPKRFNFLEDDRFRSGGGKGATVSVQNGALNLHIPMAFSYPYNVPVPPQPESNKKSSKTASLSKVPSSLSKVPSTVSKVPSGLSHMPVPPSQVPSSFRGNDIPLQKENKTSFPQTSIKMATIPATKPFVATVKSGQLYKAKKVLQPHEVSRTQAKTSVVWDFHAGQKVPFQAVDYGQELYEQAAQNLARQLEQHKRMEGKKATPGSNSTDMDDDCYDYSKPGINSSRYTSRALEKAVEDLKHLPQEVEKLLRSDKRFDPIVSTKATRALNIPRNTRVYKDLIPVDPNPEVITEAENMMQAELKRSIEAARQPSKTKDPEPKLEDFQTNSYTRIRPAAVPTPPKPTSGISTEANHDFDTIERERTIEADSNRLEPS